MILILYTSILIAIQFFHRYRWLFYINPNYYGFSASAHLILSDFKIDCDSGISSIICYFDSGDFILKRFNFDDVKPYLNIAVR